MNKREIHRSDINEDGDFKQIETYWVVQYRFTEMYVKGDKCNEVNRIT